MTNRLLQQLDWYLKPWRLSCALFRTVTFHHQDRKRTLSLILLHIMVRYHDHPQRYLEFRIDAICRHRVLSFETECWVSRTLFGTSQSHPDIPAEICNGIENANQALCSANSSVKKQNEWKWSHKRFTGWCNIHKNQEKTWHFIASRRRINW